MKKHKIILNDDCIRVIEAPIKDITWQCSMANGYSLSTAYKVTVELADERTFWVNAEEFMEFRKICRKWFTEVCERNGFTHIEFEDAK